MKLTKQQKICAAVLLLGAVALVVDRWVIGHEPEAAAGAVVKPRAAGKAAGADRGAPRASTAGTGPTRSLASRLQEVARAERLDASGVSDAFRPSRRWDPPQSTLINQDPTPPAPVKPDAAGLFRSRHELNAVMSRGGALGGIAIIDGRLLAPGMTVDGFRLVKVNEQSAVLERLDGDGQEKQTVELFIKVQQPH